MADRPIGRKKNVTDGGAGVHKRGEGLGTGPVGSPSGYGQGSGTPSGGGGNVQRGGGRSPLLLIIIAAIVLLGGGGGLSSLLGGDMSSLLGGDDTGAYTQEAYTNNTNNNGNQSQTTTTSLFDSLMGGGSSAGFNTAGSASWSGNSNTGVLDTSVAPSAAAKRTAIKGNGDDTITIMVYMCGTDLESKHAMASKDIQEMLSANVGDKINLIIYTGGCKKWQNSVVSNSVNQIYRVSNGQLYCLNDNAGKGVMTDPNNLSDFIKWTAGNFPADRYDLILWDHGGGSTTGYGYDEKSALSGAMSLAGIDKALKAGGVTFDFVGFDACLMATVETALVVSNYSDYMIASEETEPGIGWYYTKWLNELNKNTSIPTTELGKIIIDTFTDACANNVPGQKTTLSLVDLAELRATVPSELAAFSANTSELIKNKQYSMISGARGCTREFAASSKIDQIDLVDFAKRVGTSEGTDLANALLGCVKYNRTGANMTNAYGLSIYFPYKKTSKVDSMVNTYAAIGMDEEYAKCIQNFASLEVAGQVASGGTSSPMGSLFDMTGSSSQSSTLNSADLIGQLLGSFMGGDFSSISGLDASNTGFLGRSLDIDQAAEYIASTHLDPGDFIWTANDYGDSVIKLDEDKWSLVSDLELNAFYDDGEGYIDLGMDSVYEYDDDKNLLAPTDKTWLSIEKQPVAFYHLDTQGTADDYLITGRVPCMLNGERCNLIIVFSSENEDGYIAGACYDYIEGETETIAKNLTELEIGDKIDFVCDYYTYDKEYKDSYYLGETLTVDKDMESMLISNTEIGDGTTLMTYCFTDIYGQRYWTTPLRY
ncbi:MAG: peptidase C11 [Lachnospiraceae bacterium]|nr:peptidase C11 [Lachnospiraceae bacterium]